MNQTHSSALNRERARWQPVATGKTDAADFAGFWLRHQRIGTRSVYGFSGLGGGPFYGTGYYGGGGLGLVIVILLILLLMGRL